MLSRGMRATTLSGGRDPVRPTAQIPGGFVPEQSVDVSYTTSGDLAVETIKAQEWVKATSGVESVLRAVQEQIEREYGLALVPQSVTCLASGPAESIWLPRTPANEITSVKVVEEGEEGADESADYYLEAGELKKDGGNAVGIEHPIRIVYDAGWNNVPSDIELAIKRVMATHFDHRGDVRVGESVNELPNNAESILRNYERP